MACWCGKPSFRPDTNSSAGSSAHETAACREHWGQRQDARIAAQFEALAWLQPEAVDSRSGEWHYHGISPHDPGMLGGEQRHVIHKHTPMS